MSQDKEAVKQEAGVQLTASDLEKILRTVIAESKKPNEAEQRKLDAEAQLVREAQQSRLENASSVRTKMEQEAVQKRLCSHKHRTGESHGVFILDGNYILCQACQAKVRPGSAPDDYRGGDIYNTALFNEMFQTLSSTADVS